jgi:hypothetical protein
MRRPTIRTAERVEHAKVKLAVEEPEMRLYARSGQGWPHL